MSEMELHTGRVKKIDNVPTDLGSEELVKWFREQGYRIEDYEDWDGRLDIIDGDVVRLNDGFYHLIKHEEHDAFGDAAATKEDDGSFSFMCYWYNGGACFEEVLEQALKKARENDAK